MISRPLVAHLFGQITRPRRLAGLMLLASVPGMVSWLSMSGLGAADAATVHIDIVSTLSGGTLSLAVLVIAAAVMRDERDGGTLPFIFLTPIPRAGFAASAWLAAALAAALIALAGWLVGFLAVGSSTGDWSLGLAVLPTYLVAAAAYSAVFVPVGYLFSRAILVGLAYVFVWEGILASFISGLSSSSIWRLAMSVLADLVPLSRDAGDVLGTVTPGVGGALVKTAIVVVAGIGLLGWALRSRDAV